MEETFFNLIQAGFVVLSILGISIMGHPAGTIIVPAG